VLNRTRNDISINKTRYNGKKTSNLFGENSKINIMPDPTKRITVAYLTPTKHPPKRAHFRGMNRVLSREMKDRQRMLSIMLTMEGSHHISRGKYRKGIAALDRALQLYPKNLRALKHRALAKMELGLNQEALKDFETVLKLDPKDKFALYHRGLINCELKKYEQCIRDLTNARGVKNANRAFMLGKVAMMHAAMGRFAPAMEKLKAAKAIEGRYGTAVKAMRYLRAVPELSLGQQALYRPSRGGAGGARTGLGATWYLYNFNKRLTLGAVLSVGYAGNTGHHAIDLSAGAALIAEFKNIKLHTTVEAGYNFGIHGDPLAAANKAGGLFRYGMGVDFRLWTRLWLGISLAAQHDTDDFRDASLGLGVRLTTYIW